MSIYFHVIVVLLLLDSIKLFLYNYLAAFETAKSSFGRIDLLVNNAGMLNEHEWERMIEVNFVSIEF